MSVGVWVWVGVWGRMYDTVGGGELNCVWNAELHMPLDYRFIRHTSQELGYYLVYTFSVTTGPLRVYMYIHVVMYDRLTSTLCVCYCKLD